MIKGRVKEKMEEKGVSVRGLVKKTELSTCTVMRARGDKFIKCTVETLARIAEALECRVKDLFQESDEK